MEIIISANEKILNMTQNLNIMLGENMSKQEYSNWCDEIVLIGEEDEKTI